MVNYNGIRKNILEKVNTLQNKGFSYQDICNYVNLHEEGFTLFKDFFTRFRSKATYYKGPAKEEKLKKIDNYISQFYHQNISSTDLLQQYLKDLVEQALRVEFETYASINQKEINYHSELSRYYDPQQSAFLAIENNLKHKIQYGWVLDIQNQGSNFRLLSVKVDSLFSTNAVIKTDEYWKICWVDPISKKIQYNYESINQQTYLLSEEPNWLIIENIYQSSKSRIRPELIDMNHIKNMAKDRLNFQNNIDLLLANNNLLELIELIKSNPVHQSSLDQLSLLEDIKNKYLNVHRLLNTDVIRLHEFNAEMESLKKRISPIIAICFEKN